MDITIPGSFFETFWRTSYFTKLLWSFLFEEDSGEQFINFNDLEIKISWLHWRSCRTSIRIVMKLLRIYKLLLQKKLKTFYIEIFIFHLHSEPLVYDGKTKGSAWKALLKPKIKVFLNTSSIWVSSWRRCFHLSDPSPENSTSFLVHREKNPSRFHLISGFESCSFGTFFNSGFWCEIMSSVRSGRVWHHAFLHAFVSCGDWSRTFWLCGTGDM